MISTAQDTFLRELAEARADWKVLNESYEKLGKTNLRLFARVKELEGELTRFKQRGICLNCGHLTGQHVTGDGLCPNCHTDDVLNGYIKDVTAGHGGDFCSEPMS